jgi:hypothetical protein
LRGSFCDVCGRKYVSTKVFKISSSVTILASINFARDSAAAAATSGSSSDLIAFVQIEMMDSGLTVSSVKIPIPWVMKMSERICSTSTRIAS